MKQPPKVCIECNKLRISAVYMDGSCEYSCLCPRCEYREAFKEAERKERNR